MYFLLSIAPVIATGAPLPTIAPEVPSLARETGQVIARAVTFSSEFELLEMSASQDGEEIPADMMPAMTRSTSEVIDVEFVETVLSVEDGQAVKLARTYESAATHTTFDMEVEGDGMGMEPVSESDESSSDIEGQTVVVSQDGDAEGAAAWSVTAGEDCGLADEDVAGLRADYGFGMLLPRSDAEKGDEWSVDLNLLAFLLDPAGELPGDGSGEEEPAGWGAGFEKEEPEFEGEITATHSGTRDVDGVTLAVYRLRFDCGTESSFAPDLGALEVGGDEGGFAPNSLEVEIEE
ncbi:MAG: hypothetical protein AAGG01_07930, partial [Planctomycetota bacterium]